ncbi:ABC transporter type 1 [Bartonella choladocola]|uniref:Amino acid ABC transporter membrane protein 2, PAAT family n=2 Tax=Bartonellaceae TaxID=772 RepID=A0A1U9MGN4_9HYPH|nr:amino acid ABC transporter membrane protein 2, PAAT family [Bartonella choladocola]
MMIPDFLHFLVNPDILTRYGWKFVDGFFVTIKLVALSYTAGFFLSIFITLAVRSKYSALRIPARIYILFFRGSPLLAQLFLFYYGIGSFTELWKSVGLWWFFQSSWWCCLLIFALNTAGYQAEIFRGSMQSVPTGQYEAAKALGLDGRTTFIRVILPQSMIMALRPLGNEFILMVKASAVASLVTVYDIMGVAKLAYSRTFDFQVYIWAAVLYLLIVEVVRRAIGITERRLTRHLR